MDKTELKLRVDTLDALPGVPALLERAIGALIDPEAASTDFRTLACSEPALMGRLLCAAAAPGSLDGPATTPRDELFERVGEGEVRTALLEASIAALTIGPAFRHDLLIRLWTHAYTTAVLAARLAPLARDVAEDGAFFGGLFHDLGRLALLALEPERYAAIIEKASAERQPVERIERRELGLDHALVGKWLADRWRFPRYITQTIWFHHLPAGSLAGKRRTARLMETVGLACSLAHWLESAPTVTPALPRSATERAERLGLDAVAVGALALETQEEVIRFTQPLLRAHPTPGAALTALRGVTCRLATGAARGAGDSSALRDQVRWLEALNTLNVGLRPGQSVEEVLDRIVDTVRAGIGAAPGMCCVVDSDHNTLLGRVWEQVSGPAQALRIRLDGAAGPLSATESIALDALRKLGLGVGETGWDGSESRTVVRHGSLISAPMIVDGVCRGQILFDVEASGLTLHERDHVRLMAFAGACGAALARQQAYDDLNSLSEELSSALAQKENAGGTHARRARLARAGELAAGAAQAIHGPLEIIAGHARRLLQRVTDPEDARALNAVIVQERRLSKTMADLMAFAGPAAPNLKPTLINYVVRCIVDQVTDRLLLRGIAVEEQLAEGLPRIPLDRHQIEHVFLNLIENAEQAMAGAGGTLTIITTPSDDRSAVLVEFTDTGPGIPQDLADEIFEPFFSTRHNIGGTGLGLAVCRAIVEEHGGLVELLPAVDCGARFRLRFPCPVVAAAPSSAPEPAPEPVVESAPRLPALLLVEPNDTIREVLGETLVNRGYEVEAAATPAQARAAIAGRRFDAVLLDWKPGPGVENDLLDEFRHAYAAIPVILMTNAAPREEFDDALRRGARACLTKPFALKNLFDELERAVLDVNNRRANLATVTNRATPRRGDTPGTRAGDS